MGQVALPARRTVAERRRPLRERLGLTSDHPLPWLALSLGWLAVFSVFPFLYAVYRSLFSYDASGNRFRWAGLENWSRLLQDARVWSDLGVTLKYVAIGLAVELALGFAIALLYDQSPPFLGFFRSAMVLPMVIPPAVAGLMFQLLEHPNFGPLSLYAYKLGLLSPEEPLLGGTGKHAMAAILLPDVWQWTPFMALIIMAGLRGLPSEPFEAAAVDGASAWQRFRYLTLPMLRPIIAIAVLLRFIDLFRVFDYVKILTGGGPGTRTEVISYYDYNQVFGYTNWGYGAAVGVFVLVLLVVLGNVLVKLFRLQW
jgi:multiple sugar transport system permease protein